jgi:hypothetical protein
MPNSIAVFSRFVDENTKPRFHVSLKRARVLVETGQATWVKVGESIRKTLRFGSPQAPEYMTIGRDLKALQNFTPSRPFDSEAKRILPGSFLVEEPDGRNYTEILETPEGLIARLVAGKKLQLQA